MDSHKAGKIFRAVYGKDPNVMTPEFIEYGAAGKYVYELSRGTGFEGVTIYGVSVVDSNTGQKAGRGFSGCFFSLVDARAHIWSLGQPKGGE